VPVVAVVRMIIVTVLVIKLSGIPATDFNGLEVFCGDCLRAHHCDKRKDKLYHLDLHHHACGETNDYYR